MWGIIPAAGVGSRIQPLAFSKELLPVGSRRGPDGTERPRAVSEYLVERMILGGATKLCFVISPGKSDIVEYWGGEVGPAAVCYAVQPQPAGLCDALFRALPLVGPGDDAYLGLPDTIWFPEDALASLPPGLSFLCFPVDRPQLFDAVVADASGAVREIQVKQARPATEWIWGAVRVDGATLRRLHALWLERGRADEYLGTLVNAYLAAGGDARAVRTGEAYVDVGTLHGYHQAIEVLRRRARVEAAAAEGAPLEGAQPP